MKKIQIPEELKKMNAIFESNGFEAYLVGGAVRDIILNKNASDWDIATNAKPEEVISLFKKVIPTGIAHGTVTVHFMKKQIEVTTFRGETTYSDGRHPDKIYFASTIEEDLSRRDFTMNAIAASLHDGRIIDPFDGRGDIEKKLIKTVGNPYERFMEDGLRPIRALRFSGQLGFKIDSDTYSTIFNQKVQQKVNSISRERFRDEFLKIIKSSFPVESIKMMEETGILKLFIPELSECKGVSQKDARAYHVFDVFEHCLYALEGAPKDNYLVRIAALFHDIGKKDTREIVIEQNPKNPLEQFEIIHFYKHELYSAKKTATILARLKFSNAEIEKITHLVKEHMFHYEKVWSDSSIRKFIVRIGKENIEDLLKLNYADMYGKYRKAPSEKSAGIKNLIEFYERIKKVEEESTALSIKDLKVNGNDLIKLGIMPGKKMGMILNELFQCVLQDPKMNEKETLLNVVKKMENIGS